MRIFEEVWSVLDSEGQPLNAIVNALADKWREENRRTWLFRRPRTPRFAEVRLALRDLARLGIVQCVWSPNDQFYRYRRLTISAQWGLNQ